MPERVFPVHYGLFLTFADLDDCQEDILRFSRNWGMLFRHQLAEVATEAGEVFLCEPLDYWGREIRKMASAVKLWIGIRDGNPTAASAAARQIKKEGFVDVLEVLSDHVNDCASRQVDWRLVRVKDERNKCKIAPASRSLLGALWAQLCVAIVESGEFRQCPVCGKYYPIGPGYYRPDKSTCSAKCAKAHTRGHYLVRVRALSEAGLSIHEIASKIAAQAAVVRMWLSTPHDDDEDE